ncbi:MAG: tetratricopeptide repeat protein [Dysgonomonas sp.]
MLKKIFFCFTFLVLLIGSTVAQNNQEEAVKAYQDGDFEKAIGLYENELKIQKEKGYESADLYYNLGNAYFRDNEVAKAILNYERAALINPGDRDIRHNLDFARTKTEDKIISVDTFFLQSWFDSVQNLQSSNTWAKLSITFFILLVAALCVFFFVPKLFVKKVSFYAGIVLLVLVIFTNIFSYRQKSKILNRDTAIIMPGSVSVKNSPDNNSKELFILHAGTKVKINKQDGNWMEIEIANGNVGWTTKDKLEII